jgi:hypothetical protein
MPPVTDSPEPDRSAEEDADLLRREREGYLARLGEVVFDRELLDGKEHDLARYGRHIGIGWDEIAEALGMTAEAALEKFGEPPPGEDPF